MSTGDANVRGAPAISVAVISSSTRFLFLMPSCLGHGLLVDNDWCSRAGDTTRSLLHAVDRDGTGTTGLRGRRVGLADGEPFSADLFPRDQPLAWIDPLVCVYPLDSDFDCRFLCDVGVRVDIKCSDSKSPMWSKYDIIIVIASKATGRFGNVKEPKQLYFI